MFCTECGGNVSAGDRVCRSCGARLQDDRPAPVSAPVRVARPAVSGEFKKPGFGVLGITKTVLSALAEGAVIRNAVTIVMRIGAVLVLLGGLLVVIQVLKTSFASGTPAAWTVGGLLLATLLAGAAFAVAQIYLYRAQSVHQLEDSPFTVIPILSILFRTTGEAYAVGALAIGVGGCIFTWLAGASPAMLLAGMGEMMPPIPGMNEVGGSPFVSGLAFLATMVIAAFAALIAFYALAEFVIVLVDIALNVRRIEKTRAAAA